MPESRLGRDALLLLLAIPALVSVGLLSRSGSGWFPQEYAHAFFVAKGLIGLVAVTLLVVHMSRTWPYTLSTGQRLRYLALLVGTTATGSSSTVQYSDDLPVAGLNVAGLVFVTTVAIAMVVSLSEDSARL